MLPSQASHPMAHPLENQKHACPFWPVKFLKEEKVTGGEEEIGARGRWERKIESMRECVCRRRLRLGVTAVKNECDANVASAVSIRTIEDYNISIFLSDEYKI